MKNEREEVAEHCLVTKDRTSLALVVSQDVLLFSLSSSIYATGQLNS